MKLWTSSIFSAAVLGTLIACSSSPKPETAPAAAALPTDSVASTDSAAVAVKKDTLMTPKDRYSYALGMDMGRAIKNVDAEIDKELFLRSLSDQMDGKALLMTDSQAEKALQELVLQMQVTREKKAAEAAKAALDSQKVFLEKNKTVAGVITTASGLQYKYITQVKDSSARAPKLTDKVRVHYAGALLNGTEFDSSIKRGEPLEFPVNAVIKGWQELLTLMKEGEKVQAWIPSELGYGAEGASPVIPPNSLLVFEVELLNVVTASPVDTAKAVKTPEEQKADSIAAAKQAKQDSITAAKKAKTDSIAAVKAAKKAKQDSIKAAKKAKADSIAAVKAAKKAEQDSIKAAKKAEQDSIKAAKKAKQDSIAAVKKAKQDSIAAAKKAKADSIAAVKAAKKAEQDSIKAAKKAAKAESAKPAETAKTETAKPAEPSKTEAAKPTADTAKPAADTAKAAPAANK
ncbi:FKBP-type peptidyl-prolyl cis-trans isomerase [Hallerella succinigenes]|uniref:peptidylprolyl isomerase n=1 Tax=Hallerella succinigenes TaxID=1896222 RepID=A0A2M9A7D6_9BACT|nr:FKBP-type peptidyl-prolyl cis-trans isomerase [Hallerella succinigenes]PJJ41568.1 FKBP-type peptidyl-prolyl cis-trans isomerase [Hallerella succinigenes]